MTEPTPELEPVPVPRSTRGAPPWSSLVLALFVVAAGIAVALQLGAWRSQAVDRTPVEKTSSADEVPRTESPAESPPARSRDESLPAYGDRVRVDEPPEPLTRVAPTYPPEARRAGIEGTVVVQALIGRDGLVKGTRIVKSAPLFDEAALAAIEQWTFEPAQSDGEPVAVWVAVPIRFKLD
jgi:periplasmic protein TonB